MAEGIDEKERWTLRFLYAPSDHHRNRDTYLWGKTRLVKGLFLLDRHLQDEFGIDTGFNFAPHKYGPYAPEIERVLSSLERAGLVSVEEDERRGEGPGKVTRIALTQPRGIEEAQRHWETISKEIQDRIKWMKHRHVTKSIHKLLSFVYNEYPEMTINSEIKDDVLG